MCVCVCGFFLYKMCAYNRIYEAKSKKKNQNQIVSITKKNSAFTFGRQWWKKYMATVNHEREKKPPFNGAQPNITFWAEVTANNDFWLCNSVRSALHDRRSIERQNDEMKCCLFAHIVQAMQLEYYSNCCISISNTTGSFDHFGLFFLFFVVVVASHINC